MLEYINYQIQNMPFKWGGGVIILNIFIKIHNKFMVQVGGTAIAALSI